MNGSGELRRREALSLLALLLVLLTGVVSCAAEEKPKAKKKLDINTATAEELAKLPGVGEVIAARIVRHREKSGRFRSVDELLIIRGISRKKLEALRPLVTVETEGSGKKGKAEQEEKEN